MSRLIICTCGTSIATNLGIDKTFAFANSSWDDGTFEKLFIMEYTKFYAQNNNNRKKLLKASTEIAVLANVALSKGDIVALLASDTSQGRVCAREIKKLIVKLFGLDDSSVKIERIEGLNTYKHDEFRIKGLKNFVNKIGEFIDKYIDYEIIINPISGYRNLFPFMTVMGMIYGKKVVYWYELTDSITFLPPLPITFDTEIFRRAFDALKYVEDQAIVHKSEYLCKIKDYEPNEEDLFLSYVELVDDKDNVTVSPLAFTLLKIESERKTVKIIASLKDKLIKDINSAAQSIRQDIAEKLSSPLWRRNHIHAFTGTDLTVYKLGNNPVRRLAGFTDDDGDFVVTHYFTDHNDYERVLNTDKVEKFKSKRTVLWAPD